MRRFTAPVLIVVSALSLGCPRNVGSCDSNADCQSGIYCDLNYRLCLKPDLDAGDPAGPDAQALSLSVSPSSPRVVVGRTLSVSLSLQRNDKAQPFTVRIEGLPSYVTSAPVTLSAMEVQGTLLLSVAAGAPAGRVSVKVVAASGEVVVEAPLQFEIRFPPGTLDTSFGTQGLVGDEYSREPTGAWNDVALTARSELVLVGEAADGGEQMAVLDSRGRPLPEFNNGAPVRFASPARATTVAVSENRFLVASVLWDFTSQMRWVERSGASGSALPLPGINGVYGLARSTDGNTTVFGSLGIKRFLPSGDPDPAFGSNGLLQVRGIGGASVFSNSTLQLPDGRYLVAGQSLAGGGSVHDAFLKCLLANGADDLTFGELGLVRVPGQFAGEYHEYRSLALTPDGKFVTAGANRTGLLIVKRALNGALDPTFGEDGKAFYPFGPDPMEIYRGYAEGLAVQKDGRILVAGGLPAESLSGTAAVFRFLPDGKRDLEFGKDGVVTTRRLAGSRVLWTTIALDGDDTFVVAGYAVSNDSSRAFVSRYYQ